MQKALDTFIRTYVGPPEFDAVLLPTLEKALSKGAITGKSLLQRLNYDPHCAVPGPRAFFSTFNHPISIANFRTLLPHILNLAKSATTYTLKDVIDLFRGANECLCASTDHTDAMETEMDQAREAILALPRARKTASADHRAALYGMLSCLAVPKNVGEGVTALLALLTSETAPGAAEVLGSVLERWIVALLASDLPPKKAGDAGVAVVRGMGSKSGPGAAVRRAWWTVGAGVLWVGARDSEAYIAFARALLPALETALGAVGTGVNAKDEPLWEACLAAACLLRIAAGGKAGGELAKSTMGLPVVRAIVAPAAGDKHLWFFNERVLSRIGAAKEGVTTETCDQEALWFVRALDGIWTLTTSGTTYVLCCPQLPAGVLTLGFYIAHDFAWAARCCI